LNLIDVNDVGKSFRTYRSEWQRIGRWFGLPTRPSEENWVLRHVSFTIQKGEAIGIIGQNGAGKSTLLKIITNTLQSTEGSVAVNGRVAAILELGMGFNPDLTGRQNVLHAAGLMGFSAEEIQNAMTDIEGFAEVGEYFEQPVRTYSSGMHVRLAFAIATAYRPEILIVDEALSVGDSYFQHKSFARIREFQEQGTTLLIVAHDRAAIQSVCNRAILLEGGLIVKDAKPEEVFDFYNALIAEKENAKVETVLLESGKVKTTSGTGEAEIQSVELVNQNNEPVEVVSIGERVTLIVSTKVAESLGSLVMGFCIKDRLGQIMYGTNTWHTKQVIEEPVVGGEFQFRIEFDANLGVGSYSIAIALHDRENHLSANYEWRDLALVFNVLNSGVHLFEGCNWLQPEIEVNAI
jgi:lipopolysaccharide transport system ATP-binding protein|tara:strand:+ start:1035 stop:2255 length:1221 start_codon:yes stop_codon:yes gene_type:complete